MGAVDRQGLEATTPAAVDGWFDGAGGERLFRRSWLPDGESRASLVLVHGFGEHCGRYPHVVDELVSHGWALHSFDHRGHGRSPGKRGHIRHWQEYREDLHLFLATVDEEVGAAPLFLMGHSMGGLIVLEYVLRHAVEAGARLAGVVASAPPLAPPRIAPLLRLASRILTVIWPGLQLRSGLDPKGISRHPEVVEAYVADPLVHSLGTPRLATELAAAAAWTARHAGRCTLPLLVLHGGADPLVPAAGSRSFYEAAATPDKEHIEYAGGFHEPHNDVQHREVTADLRRWLEERLAGGRSP